jgi:hypothetical protein
MNHMVPLFLLMLAPHTAFRAGTAVAKSQTQTLPENSNVSKGNINERQFQGPRSFGSSRFRNAGRR